MKFIGTACLWIALMLSGKLSQAQYPGLDWAFSFGAVQEIIFDNGLFDDGSKAYAMAKDDQGNIYVVGTFCDTIDIDPSSSLFSIYNESSFAITGYVAKYSTSGTLVWARCLNSVNYHLACSDVTVSKDGSVYLTGTYGGTVDFDGGPNVFTLNGGSAYSAYVCKYDTAGNFTWVASLGNSSNNTFGYNITTDKYGNVCSAGYSEAGGDFDPGVGVASLTELFTPYISKVSSNGDYIWAKQIVGDYSISDIATDTSGNLIVAGSHDGISFNPLNVGDPINLSGENAAYVFKLSTAGSLLWRSGFQMDQNTSGQSFCKSISCDDLNDVYITGWISGTVDFNPLPTDTFFLTASSDMFFGKLNGDGNLEWVKSLVKTPGNTTGTRITFDNSYNIYVSGYYNDTVDLDPSSTAFYLTGFSSATDYSFISKYNPSGNFLWAFSLNLLGNDEGPKDICVTEDNSIYVTGDFFGTRDFDPTSAVYNLTAHTTYYDDVFVMKLNQNVSGIFDVTRNEPLRLFPNPTTKLCFIDVKNSTDAAFVTLNIFDVYGRMVRTHPIQHVGLIEVELPETPGIYLVQIVTDNGTKKPATVIRQ